MWFSERGDSEDWNRSSSAESFPMQSNSDAIDMHAPALAGRGRGAKSSGAAWRYPCRLMQIAVLTSIAFLLAAPAWSLDGGGRLSGLVTHPSEAAMAGVTVEAVCMETGRRYNSATNAEGLYAFPVLPVGHYELRID